MPSRSTLELMLENIQKKLENEAESPPPLPARPVSRTRLPSQARRACPQTHHFKKANSTFMIEPVLLDSAQQFIQTNELDDLSIKQAQIQGVLILQSCYRGYRARCYANELKGSVITLQSCNKEHVQISYSTIFELRRQVLKTEAALHERKEQNAALMNNVKQYEKRWLEYENKMKSMEKMWQEQLTSIQVNLVDAAKEKVAARTMPKSPELLQVESPLDIIDYSAPRLNNHQNAELEDKDDGNYFEVKLGCRITKKDVVVEFQKLESQFGAWEKDYTMTLEETKATMKKLSVPLKEKSQKRWWRRPMRHLES